MAVLVLNQAEVERLLDMEGCIEAMADALASLARGEVHVPLRFLVNPENEACSRTIRSGGWMPIRGP